MPRSVFLRVLQETLHCTNSVRKPCSANSCRQNVLAKYPRRSTLRSCSITHASVSSVALKITEAALAAACFPRREASRRDRGRFLRHSPAQIGAEMPAHKQATEMVNAYV